MGTKSLTLTALVFSAVISGACTHSMRVKNLNEYRISSSSAGPHQVAIRPFNGPSESIVFFEHAVDALRVHPSVGRVRTNWTHDSWDPGFKPDVILGIRPHVDYRGSGWNFPITFPGFLIFAHSWNGYVYHADVETEIEVIDPETFNSIEKKTIKMDYSMRHTDPGRGFWASSGWWTPGWGVTSLIAAPFLVKYDDAATDEFEEEVSRPYGEFIAEKIMQPSIALVRDRRRSVSQNTLVGVGHASPLTPGPVGSDASSHEEN